MPSPIDRLAPNHAASAGRAVPTGRIDKRYTKLEWSVEWLRGLERGEHTGRVLLDMHFNRGGITRVVPMLEVAVDHLGS